MKPLRSWVREGRTLIGCFLSLPSPLTTEIIGMAGYDWVVIDKQYTGRHKEILFFKQVVYSILNPCAQMSSPLARPCAIAWPRCSW